MKRNSEIPTRAGSSLKTSQSTQSTTTVQAQILQERLMRNKPFKFYKTKDMREHEEKSKIAVKTFLENLNRRTKKVQHSTMLSQSQISASATTATKANAKASSSRLTAGTTTQKIKSSQNNKIESTKTKTSLDSNGIAVDVQFKEPLKFYKTKVMREHEEKSKWAVQTFWENLNSRSKKLVQDNESQSSVNISDPISQTFSIQSKKETPVRLTEQVTKAVAKDKTIIRNKKDSFLSTSKVVTREAISRSMMGGIAADFIGPYASSSSSIVQGPMKIVPNAPAKVSNKRKHSGDGEIGNNKLIKIIPSDRKQREFTKINLPNRPAPQINNIVSSGTSKNNGVKSLVQLCTMTLVSNKHRLYQLGDTPYHLLEPILKFCTDEELQQLEEVNFRLIDEDMELWKRFLMQKRPSQPLPDNPKDYRKTYLSIIKEEKEKKERIISNLRRAMAEEKAKKEARQVKMLAVAPREPKRKPSGYQKLSPFQKIRRELIRGGFVTFPHR